MSLNLIRRLVKGTPLTSADHDGNLDKLETAVLARALAGAIGSSGITMGAGIVGRESGSGAPQVFTLGSGLAIVNGALTATGGGGGGGGSGTVTSVAMTVPLGFSVAGSPITTTGTLALTFLAGYSLPTTASQASWDIAAGLASTALQPAGLASALALKADLTDARFTDPREWSADTISQAEAEAGTTTTRRAFTAQRVFQAVAAWWAASAAATKLAGIATGATANATDAQLRDRSTHTGTQPAGTITGLATVATSGAYGDLSGRPAIPASAADVGALPLVFTAGAITYAAQVTLDLAVLAGCYRTISLTGALEFLTSNRTSGRTVTLRLICDATARALTFPAGWVFIGTKPSSIAASKTAVLSLTFFGTTDADCVAAYGVQT